MRTARHRKRSPRTRGIVVLEYLILGTIVGIGAIAGLGVYRSALIEEYDDLGEAVQTLNQGYAIAGVSWGSAPDCAGYVNGSHYHEQPEAGSGITWFGGLGPDGSESVDDADGVGTPHPLGSLSFSFGGGVGGPVPLPTPLDEETSFTLSWSPDGVFGSLTVIGFNSASGPISFNLVPAAPPGILAPNPFSFTIVPAPDIAAISVFNGTGIPLDFNLVW